MSHHDRSEETQRELKETYTPRPKLGTFPVGARVRVGTAGLTTVIDCTITSKSPGSVYVEWYEPCTIRVTDKDTYRPKEVHTRRKRSAAFSLETPAQEIPNEASSDAATQDQV